MKKRIMLLISSLLCLVFLVSCGSKSGSKNSASKAAKKDTLIVATTTVKTLDPQMSSDLESRRVFTQIYEPLVAQDSDMKIVPALAESWEKVDDLTTVFKLKKDIKFHNGEAFKASDVKFSLDRAMNSPIVGQNLKMIDKVEVIDDYTVKITTKFTFAPLLNHLAHHSGYIISEKVFKELGDNIAHSPIGTGPYKFVEWKSGEGVKLIVNEDYHKGASPIKNVQFKFLLGSTNKTIGLETGEVDIAYDIDSLDSNKVKEYDNLSLVFKPSLNTTYVGFNTTKAPYNDVRIRQALAYLIDRQSIVDSVFEGFAEVAKSVIPPDVFGYSPDGKQYERNVDKAKELLAEAGYPDGFKATIWVNDNPIRVAIATILQDQFKDAGIDLTIETLEWGAFLDGTGRGEHQMFILGWGSGVGDADYGIRSNVSEATLGSGGNRSFYINKDVDRLLDEGASESDPEKRKAIYRELQILLNEELPTWSICNPIYTVGLHNYVKGFEFKPDLKHSLYGISFAD